MQLSVASPRSSAMRRIRLGRRAVRSVPWLLAVALCLAALIGPASRSAGAAPSGYDSAHVYLIRGFMNVFSLGLDDFAATLNRNGIRADVYNHMLINIVTSEAEQEYKSGRTKKIILIGHSLGINAVIEAVGEFARLGVPVALVVTLDSVSLPVPSGNVERFIHLYISTGVGGPLIAGPDFRGRLINIDLSKRPEVGHLTIDKESVVHSMMLGYIRSAIQGGGRPPAAAKPRLPASAPTPRPRASAPSAVN
jgi:hypothetical protein